MSTRDRSFSVHSPLLLLSHLLMFGLTVHDPDPEFTVSRRSLIRETGKLRLETSKSVFHSGVLGHELILTVED